MPLFQSPQSDLGSENKALIPLSNALLLLARVHLQVLISIKQRKKECTLRGRFIHRLECKLRAL